MLCHVLIPVGPGHEHIKDRALESVRIAATHAKGPFDDVRVRMCDDTRGELGRSAARNLLVAESDADWVFFLDADDLIAPNAFTLDREFFWHDAIFGAIAEYHDGCILNRYQTPVSSIDNLLEFDPYLCLQMGHFVRREVAAALPFNESMDCGEDVEYYLRLWSQFNCVKLFSPLMYNVKGEHSTGPKSATGEQWRLAVADVIERFKAQREAA